MAYRQDRDVLVFQYLHKKNHNLDAQSIEKKARDDVKYEETSSLGTYYLGTWLTSNLYTNLALSQAILRILGRKPTFDLFNPL